MNAPSMKIVKKTDGFWLYLDISPCTGHPTMQTAIHIETRSPMVLKALEEAAAFFSLGGNP